MKSSQEGRKLVVSDLGKTHPISRKLKGIVDTGSEQMIGRGS